MRTYFVSLYSKVARALLPHFLQKAQLLVWVTGQDFAWITGNSQVYTTGSAVRHLAWLRCLMEPLQALNTSFRAYVADVRYRMYLTGQVIYLEHFLNDIYDPIARRIYIEDGDATRPALIYNKEETQTPDLVRNKSEGGVQMVLYNKQEAFGVVDFVIVIPFSNLPSFYEAQMKRNTNKYKQAGKRYRIDTTPGGPIFG